jgi:hypothetical protein
LLELGDLKTKDFTNHINIGRPVTGHQEVMVGGEPVQLQVKIFVTTFDKINRNQARFHDVTSMIGKTSAGMSVCMVLVKYNKTALERRVDKQISWSIIFSLVAVK